MNHTSKPVSLNPFISATALALPIVAIVPLSMYLNLSLLTKGISFLINSDKIFLVEIQPDKVMAERDDDSFYQ